MQLNGYLNRIGYRGIPRVDQETLFALHRAHRRTIPYENLDIALGRVLTLDEADFYDKLVMRQRGGWCYEMNGLFAWALREIGFEVTFIAGTVGRLSAEKPDGTHMILIVQLDEPYLADVGFGSGWFEPLPLKAGIYQQGFRTYRLAHEGERWFFTNHTYGTPGMAGAGIDFTLRPHGLDDFAPHCTYLQTSPESRFVQMIFCNRSTEEELVMLQGAVQRKMTAAGITGTTIETCEAYQQVLSTELGIHLPAKEIETVWRFVWERHQSWLATRPT